MYFGPESEAKLPFRKQPQKVECHSDGKYHKKKHHVAEEIPKIPSVNVTQKQKETKLQDFFEDFDM